MFVAVAGLAYRHSGVWGPTVRALWAWVRIPLPQIFLATLSLWALATLGARRNQPMSRQRQAHRSPATNGDLGRDLCASEAVGAADAAPAGDPADATGGELRSGLKERPARATADCLVVDTTRGSSSPSSPPSSSNWLAAVLETRDEVLFLQAELVSQ